MVFPVAFTGRAAAKFRKIDKPVRRRIGARLGDVAEHPARHFRRLVGIGSYSLRVGDRRVITEIDREKEAIHVVSVGHRGTVYG